jgi:hypothetical protein
MPPERSLEARRFSDICRNIITAGAFVDRVNCGPGRDSAVVDSSDRVRNCENVKRR